MSGRFEAQETGLEGLTLLKRKTLGDDRGFLSRLFCASDLTALGWTGGIAQINETGTTHRATVRGLHFQRPPLPRSSLSPAHAAPSSMSPSIFARARPPSSNPLPSNSPTKTGCRC